MTDEEFQACSDGRMLSEVVTNATVRAERVLADRRLKSLAAKDTRRIDGTEKRAYRIPMGADFNVDPALGHYVIGIYDEVTRTWSFVKLPPTDLMT